MIKFKIILVLKIVLKDNSITTENFNVKTVTKDVSYVKTKNTVNSKKNLYKIIILNFIIYI